MPAHKENTRSTCLGSKQHCSPWPCHTMLLHTNSVCTLLSSVLVYIPHCMLWCRCVYTDKQSLSYLLHYTLELTELALYFYYLGCTQFPAIRLQWGEPLFIWNGSIGWIEELCSRPGVHKALLHIASENSPESVCAWCSSRCWGSVCPVSSMSA